MKSMHKAISISCFGHGQKSGLRRLLYHLLETAGFNRLGQTKLRLKSSGLSVSQFPNLTELEPLTTAGPRCEKQGRDITCTTYRMGDIGNNVIKRKKHYYWSWKLTFSRCCQATGVDYCHKSHPSPAAFLPCDMWVLGIRPQALGWRSLCLN